MKRVVILLGLVALAGRPLAAQCSTPNGAANGTCSSNIASSLTIPTLIRFSINDTSTTLPTPTETDYTNQKVYSTGPTVVVKANNTWSVSIRATTATWSATGTGARANKPVSDLLWNITGSEPYAAMTTTATTVKSGSRGPGTGANTFTIFYRTNYDWALDTPGTYKLTVIFTATTP